MFEIILQRLLAAIGAGDQLIAVMGPSTTVLLAWICGGAVAQFLKFPLAWKLTSDAAFSWFVRAIAIAATWAFVHWLSDTLALAAEIAFAMLQPVVYHYSLRIIRRFWPWLETKTMVGAVDPPASAYHAEARRQAEKAGEEDGA